jgi:uncharacterized protein involved in high-affinity Fe2+ transport
MKKKLVLLGMFLVMSVFSAKAQQNKDEVPAENQNTIAHRVEMGETVMLICKKYLVAPDDIYKLNPDAVDGISQGMVLKVPSDKKVEIKPAKKQPVVNKPVAAKPSKAVPQ